MNRRHLMLAAAFVVCAIVLVVSARKPPEEIVEAAPRMHAAPSAARAGNAASDVAIAALRARQGRDGAAGHHALFGALWLAPPLPSLGPGGADVPPLPSGPLVPAMPFAYLGKQSSEGRWEVYLSRGDDTLIVREQSIIDDTYRVEAIAPPTMTLVYLPLKLVQTLDIGSAD